jgi:hypothetical protein
MRGKKDWWELLFSVAVVTVWLGVAVLADRPAAPPENATAPATPAAIGAATPATPARS